MRTHLFSAVLAASAALGGCKWTDFDDLADETWVRSVEDPGTGGSDFAIAIAGVSTGPSGGTLAVISDDTPSFATIAYSDDGGDTSGPPIELTNHKIGALAEFPVFAASDVTGEPRIGLVESSLGAGNYAVLFGSPTAPAGLEFAAATMPPPAPDAATFIGDNLVFAAGDVIYVVRAAGGTPEACAGTDQNGMPLQVAALATDGPNLWVWTKAGSLIAFPQSAVLNCLNGALPAPNAEVFEPATAFMPGPGARLMIEGNTAVLAARATGASTGKVFVVELSTLTEPGPSLTIEGLRSAVLAFFGGPMGAQAYVAVGIPDRVVDDVVAGVVELYALNTGDNTVGATPALVLRDSRPESGQQFGRTLATMRFNIDPILVVGAKTEVFSYFRTALYNQLP